MARGQKAVNADGTPAKKRVYARKPKSDGEASGESAPVKKSRWTKKASSKDVAIFGVHNALYEEIQLKAEISKIIGKHMAALSSEINMLGDTYREQGKYIVQEMVSRGMDVLSRRNAERAVLPIAAKPAAERVVEKPVEKA